MRPQPALRDLIVARRAKKNRRKVAFPPAKLSSDRSALGSELVVHESPEDRCIIVDLRGRIHVREERVGEGVRACRDVGVAEVGVEILSADRYVVGDRVFNARADCPADARGARAAAPVCVIKGVVNVEVRASAAVRDAARSIDLETIVRRDNEPNLTAGRSQPVQARLGVHVQGVTIKNEGNSSPGKRRTAVVEVLAERRAVEVGYDAEHECSGLPVVASLATADEAALAISDPAREVAVQPEGARGSDKRRVAAAAGDDPAGVKTDIEPGPGEGRRHKDGRRRLSFLVGRSAACAANAPAAASAAIATPFSQFLIICCLRVDTRRHTPAPRR